MSDNKGILAPNTNNYTVGKGFLIFKPDGEEDFFHLGNVPSYVLTLAVEKLDHYSSMAGTKEKDASIVTQKTGTVKVTMEELTVRNVALMMMGDVNDDDPNNIHISIFAKSSIQGELRFYATNDVGPRYRIFLNRVQFTPGGDFNPISEQLVNMVLSGDVYSVDGAWGDAYLVYGAAPENITLPFIVGTPSEGTELTVSNGGWIDVVEFSYQWKADGTNIVGETHKTYTVQVGDHGKVLTCVVTGTNDYGSASATSVGTDPITT